jgi:hypothetical protein
MKIISKYKDYYDYLQGIYGIDPLKVLDRTKHGLYNDSDKVYSLGLVFCGDNYTRYLRPTKPSSFRYTRELEEFERLLSRIKNNTQDAAYVSDDLVWIKTVHNSMNSVFRNNHESNLSNSEFPYFIKQPSYLSREVLIPKLDEIKFNHVMSAEMCYLEIERFISYREPDPDSDPDDMVRYEQKGFDAKTSFRKL